MVDLSGRTMCWTCQVLEPKDLVGTQETCPICSVQYGPLLYCTVLCSALLLMFVLTSTSMFPTNVCPMTVPTFFGHPSHSSPACATIWAPCTLKPSARPYLDVMHSTLCAWSHGIRRCTWLHGACDQNESSDARGCTVQGIASCKLCMWLPCGGTRAWLHGA